MSVRSPLLERLSGPRHDPVFPKRDIADYMGVGGLKQPFHVAMSSAKSQRRSLNEHEGLHNPRMSEGGSRDFDVCCDCFMQFTISVDIPKRNRGVFMFAKVIAMRDMRVPLALLVTHVATLVVGKRLVCDEGVYKSRETMRFLFFITHCFLQFTKSLLLDSDGVTKREIELNDDCGVERRSKN